MDREQFVAEMVAGFKQDCQQIFDKVEEAPKGKVVETVEFDVREMAHARYRQVVEKAVEVRERNGERKKGLVCSCQQPMRMVSQRPKSILSVVGELRFKRRYYRCDACGASRVPFDEDVGLNQRYTSGAMRLMTRCGAQHSFRQAQDELWELAGLKVSDNTIRHKTLQIAHQIRRQQQAGHPPQTDPAARYGPQDRVYITMDATKANTREDGWRDVKLSALYDQQLQRKHYVANLQPAHQFGLTVRQYAGAVGVWQAREKVGAGDGADWVWRQLEVNFPILDHHVLDFYHLGEHVYKAAWTIHPEGSDRGQRWAKAQLHLAKHHGGQRLIAALELSRKRDKRPKAKHAIQQLVDYLTKHKDRMNYPQMLAAGIRIGTGPLESGCKNVIGQRLKGRGMRWRVENAEAMACLRALLASSGCWNALWIAQARAA